MIKKDAEISWEQLFPILKARWFKKDNNFVEPSEEVRLFLIKLVTAYVKHCPNAVKEYPAYAEEICQDILFHAVTDHHPEVKKASIVIVI